MVCPADCGRQGRAAVLSATAGQTAVRTPRWRDEQSACNGADIEPALGDTVRVLRVETALAVKACWESSGTGGSPLPMAAPTASFRPRLFPFQETRSLGWVCLFPRSRAFAKDRVTLSFRNWSGKSKSQSHKPRSFCCRHCNSLIINLTRPPSTSIFHGERTEPGSLSFA